MKKKLEKDAYAQNKAVEENREAARQARKLEFLITQTELYSHFVGKKDKVGDGEDEGESEEEGTQDADIPDFDNGGFFLFVEVDVWLRLTF